MRYVLNLIVISFFFTGSNGLSQDYLWPTSASQYLTSSFAEYRSGHFHAGIDIKTWGREGYEVYAIQDGYVSRLRVSPYGYGKAVYLKLDTGEVVVYAHLSRFNDEIDQYVKNEQQRKDAYRIQKYFNSSQFPVKQGDIIGYTGSTGIGAPHLHFEMRDAYNRPINPFLKGYAVADKVPPTVREISITPLDFHSRVNADVVPLILKPDFSPTNQLNISATPFLSGRIGFAVNCYDKADRVNNQFAVYKLRFFVDEQLKYEAVYDKFSYSQSHMIDFDRDYRLRKRGKGIFQNLYKIKLNELPFYQPQGDEIGILNCSPSMFNSYNQNIIASGLHQYRIELYDFWGNLTTVNGQFTVGEKSRLTASFEYFNSGELIVSDLRDESDEIIQRFDVDVSSDQGITWSKQGVHTDSSGSPWNYYLSNDFIIYDLNLNDIIKITAFNDLNILSFPLFYSIKNYEDMNNDTEHLNLEKDFYDDYVRFEIRSNNPLNGVPKLYVKQSGMSHSEVAVYPKSMYEYYGIYQLIPHQDGPFSIEVTAKDISNVYRTYQEKFNIATVNPTTGGYHCSDDSLFTIQFGGNSVYDHLFLRIEKLDSVKDNAYEILGQHYNVQPQDILLKGRATIRMNYPPSDSLAEKLALYAGSGRRYSFIGNQLDSVNHEITATVSSLNTYAVIRDVIPPEIWIKQPKKFEFLSDPAPSFVAVVHDKLSGIANEQSIIMKLDGKKVIAEYDPEHRTITYQCDMPLNSGEHELSVFAIDNCRNKRLVVNKFFIK